jgi:hypothetical protein
MNLVTLKAAAKDELLFNKPASGGQTNSTGVPPNHESNQTGVTILSI